MPGGTGRGCWGGHLAPPLQRALCLLSLLMPQKCLLLGVRSEIRIIIGLHHHLMAFYFRSVKRSVKHPTPRAVGSSCLDVCGHLCKNLSGLWVILQSQHPQMVFKIFKVLGEQLVHRPAVLPWTPKGWIWGEGHRGRSVG